MRWFAKELLEKRQSNLWVIWAVTCAIIYAAHGWWAIILLLAGAVIVTVLEEIWEIRNER